jgi:hypothetical protein
MKIRVKMNEVMELRDLDKVKARYRFGIFSKFFTYGGHDYFG